MTGFVDVAVGDDRVVITGRAPLAPGAEYTARGIRGRLRFRTARVVGTVVEVDGYDRDGRVRTVTADRVRTVHRTRKTRVPEQIKPRPRRATKGTR